MSLKRILKLLAAILTGQGVTLITQLLVPPFFLHRYPHGVQIYGEWVALTAAVAYLNSLNYGIQSYANNQMTIHYNRGEKEQARAIQASAILLLLVGVAVLICAGSSILFMPLSSWLSLTTVSSRAASLTVFILLAQLLINWFFALVANSYMVIGEAHRGQLWINGQRLTLTFALAACLWHRASFPVLALSQLLSVVLFTGLVTIDIRLRAPVLLPSLRYGSWKVARSIISPSAYFVLIALSGFLTWQGPVLLIQKILGPTMVAVFALTRIVFSMSRQILIVITYAIGQDITHLVGQRAWQQLRRLYDLSERVVLLLVPTITVGTLLLCPLLFSVWLHKRDLFEPGICMLMAVVSAVMGIKEHKYQFQWSSNQHTSLAKMMILGYSLMLAAGALVLKPFGLIGFLWVWLATEIALVAYILTLNVRLFPPEIKLSLSPVFRLAIVLACSFAIAAWPCWHSVHWSLIVVLADAVGVALGLGATSYFCFDLREVLTVVQSRIRRREAIAN